MHTCHELQSLEVGTCVPNKSVIARMLIGTAAGMRCGRMHPKNLEPTIAWMLHYTVQRFSNFRVHTIQRWEGGDALGFLTPTSIQSPQKIKNNYNNNLSSKFKR